MGVGQSQVLREERAGAQAEGCTPLTLPCLREKKRRQKEQALDQGFIYQYRYRHRDSGTSQSTANYFLLLLWQQASSFLVYFAGDWITTAPKCAVASLAMAFEVNCGSQIYALLQNKANLILCRRQQSCQCRRPLHITASVMDWGHREGSLSTERGNVLPTPSTGHLERQENTKTEQLQKS